MLTYLKTLGHGLSLSCSKLLLPLLLSKSSGETLVDLHRFAQLLLVDLEELVLLLEFSLGSCHVLHEKLTLATELHTGTQTCTGRTCQTFCCMLLLAAQVN